MASERPKEEAIADVMDEWIAAYPRDVFPDAPMTDAVSATVLRAMLPRIKADLLERCATPLAVSGAEPCDHQWTGSTTAQAGGLLAASCAKCGEVSRFPAPVAAPASGSGEPSESDIEALWNNTRRPGYLSWADVAHGTKNHVRAFARLLAAPSVPRESEDAKDAKDAERWRFFRSRAYLAQDTEHDDLQMQVAMWVGDHERPPYLTEEEWAQADQEMFVERPDLIDHAVDHERASRASSANTGGEG